MTLKTMTLKKIIAVSLLSGAALLAGCSHRTVVYVQPPPGVSIHEQGVHDGFEAARSDVAAGRPPSFAQHPRYRHPPVPGGAWGDYRNGFRDGYERFLHHGPPPPADL
jgi:hypothetical protein